MALPSAVSTPMAESARAEPAPHWASATATQTLIDFMRGWVLTRELEWVIKVI